MRCRLCKHKAVYAELRFCKVHFLNYYEKKVRYYLDRAHVKGKKILIGVSGGKDSAATASVLKHLRDEYDLDIGLFGINLGIPNYSDPGMRAAEELGKQLGLPVTIWNLKDFPKQIPEFAQTRDGRPAKPCSQCGVIKRYLLNKAARDLEYDYVATGHNLDDEHYFINHSLEQNDMVQLLRSDKQLPPKPEQKLAGRLKPLYYLSEKENMIYCLLKELPVDNKECPFSVGNPQLAFKIKNAGLGRQKKASFLKSIRKMKRLIPEQDSPDNQQLIDCQSCGYPTTRTDACVYCKIMSQS